MGIALAFLCGIALLIGGFSLGLDGLRLRFRGRGAEAIVTSAPFFTDPHQIKYVTFDFIPPGGNLMHGIGNTYQPVVKGSLLHIAYLPDDPRRCLPTDDPQMGMGTQLGLVLLGLFVCVGATINLASDIRRRKLDATVKFGGL